MGLSHQCELAPLTEPLDRRSCIGEQGLRLNAHNSVVKIKEHRTENALPVSSKWHAGQESRSLLREDGELQLLYVSARRERLTVAEHCVASDPEPTQLQIHKTRHHDMIMLKATP